LALNFDISSLLRKYIYSSTPLRTCCEARVMLCMTKHICAPLQSAGGFILKAEDLSAYKIKGCCIA